MKNRLVTLGSAAVLAVYAAGYERTRVAAQKFAGDAGDRRPPPPSAETPVRPATSAISPAAASLPRPAPTRAPEATSAAAQSSGAVTSPARESAPPPVRAADSLAALLPVKTIDTTAAEEKQEKQDKTEKPAAKWKDGSYSGWGTSRHGDIQATVVIEDGHIIGASISQCLTRYSCSWISALPPQVISRQGANVDYVSGATQSTNAFYYAVLEALSKAK